MENKIKINSNPVGNFGIQSEYYKEGAYLEKPYVLKVYKQKNENSKREWEK